MMALTKYRHVVPPPHQQAVYALIMSLKHMRYVSSSNRLAYMFLLGISTDAILSKGLELQITAYIEKA